MNNIINSAVTSMNLSQRKMLANTVIKNSYKIGEQTLATVPIDLLHIQSYQRNESNTVSKIAQNWDNRKCGVLLVSYDKKNHWFNIVDGQHRATAAKMIQIEYLVCEILFDLDTSKEAMLFSGQNEFVKKLAPKDTFKASQFVSEEDDTALTIADKKIKRVCENHNVMVSSVTNSLKPHYLTPITEARAIVTTIGEEGLDWIFSVIEDSGWDVRSKGYSYNVLNPLRRIYVKYNKTVNLDILKSIISRKVSGWSPDVCFTIAQGRYSNATRSIAMYRYLDDEVMSIVSRKTA